MPETLADSEPFVCTDTDLIVRTPLPYLDEDVRDAIVGWLHDHGLDEGRVIAGYPITRDPRRREIRWTARSGKYPVMMDQEAPYAAPSAWPAPFPDRLLHPPTPWADRLAAYEEQGGILLCRRQLGQRVSETDAELLVRFVEKLRGDA